MVGVLHIVNLWMGTMEPAVRHLPASFFQIASRIATGTIPDERAIVSLFSGCGGLDLGFLGGFPFAGRYFDRLPFKVIWANESDPVACKTYHRNLKHQIHHGLIADMLPTLPDAADIVLGGFPCQDVSVNGKGQAEKGERTILYKSMLQVIEKVKPLAFVAENVKGLLSHAAFHKRMIDEFKSLEGYQVSEQVYRASDYGVPQHRDRLIIVGVKGDKAFTPPDQTDYVLTAKDVLGDLETRPEDAKIGHVWSKALPSPDQGNRKLRADEPATTIRAEHHGNTQWHYSRPRRISLREAARLQSFPDAFVFTGGMRHTERQIGNAVPPVLAWHIAKALRTHLDK